MIEIKLLKIISGLVICRYCLIIICSFLVNYYIDVEVVYNLEWVYNNDCDNYSGE